MLAREVKYLERNLPGIERIGLRYATLGPLSALRQEMVVASIDQTFLAEGPLPRSREQLEQRISERRAALVGNSNQLCGWLDSALAEWHALRPMLQKPKDLRLAPLCQSQLEHARRLIAPGFLARTPWPRLAHLARYLRAINLRLEKAPRQLDRDRNHQHDLDRIGSRIDALASRECTLAVDSNAITTLRWQLEELQVSLFAQELGTEGRVSVVRIERELELLERGPSSS